MFKNHMNHNNSYRIESEQVQTCLRIKNHINLYHIESEQVKTCWRISSNCTKWFKGLFESLKYFEHKKCFES